MNKMTAISAVAALVCAAPSQALTVFDIAGTGLVCTYTGSSTCDTQFLPFTGVITLDVNPAPPSSDPGHFTDGATYDEYYNGWVDFSLQVAWSGGTFSTGAVAGATYSDALGFVGNDWGTFSVDELSSRFISESITIDGRLTNRASFTRNTYDTTWLSSLNFIESAGLAPVALNNNVYFENSSCDRFGQVCNGFYGSVNLTSMIARSATAVPEPVSLSLVGLGLAAFGYKRRRKARV